MPDPVEQTNPRKPQQGDADWYGQQGAGGVDLSMIRENLRLTPLERLRKADRLRRTILRLNELGGQRKNPA